LPSPNVSEREPPIDLERVARELDAFLKPESGARQARRRERILQAATELFVAHGYRKTSVEEIARAAGVAKGTVYLYYQNKAELLLHAIALEKRHYLQEMSPVFDPARSPIDRLRTMIRLSLSLSAQMPLTHRSVSSDHELEQVLQELDDQTITQINATQIDFLADLLDGATKYEWPRRDLEQRAELLVDLMYAVVNGGRQIRNGMSIEAYAKALADVIVDGVLDPISDE
jgi:AcrR family transcriptional regulator